MTSLSLLAGRTVPVVNQDVVFPSLQEVPDPLTVGVLVHRETHSSGQFAHIFNSMKKFRIDDNEFYTTDVVSKQLAANIFQSEIIIESCKRCTYYM